MLCRDRVPGIREIAVGVGINVGQQQHQGGVGDLLLKIPLLSVGGGAQGALLIGAQGAGGAKARYIHLLVKDVGQAHVVDGAAVGLVADGPTADGHVGAAFLGDGAGGAGQPCGEGRQGQSAQNAHQRQQQGYSALDKFVFQSDPSIKG